MRFVPIFLSSFVMTSTVFSMTLAGCSKEGETEPPMTPASAPNPAARNAGESIAAARCDQRTALQRHRTERQVRLARPLHDRHAGRRRQEVNHCRLGIDQEDLRECLNEISDQRLQRSAR